MARCTKLRKKKREVCLGDMRDMVILQNRSIQPPNLGTFDYTEEFDSVDEIFAMVNTVNGKTFFDSVGTSIPITHEITIRFDETVTDETWILYKDRRLDILAFENLDERDEYLFLECTDRGVVSAEASQASF